MSFLKTKKNVILFLYFAFQIAVITLYNSSYSLISITEDIFIITYLVFSFLILFLFFITPIENSHYLILVILWLIYFYLSFYNILIILPMIGVSTILSKIFIKKKFYIISIITIIFSIFISFYSYMGDQLRKLDEFRPYIIEIIPNGQKQIVITEHSRRDFFYGGQIVYALEKEYFGMIKKRDIIHTLSWSTEEILEAKWINNSEVKIGDKIFVID